MATTLAFAAMTSDGVFVAHIGDSRVYQIRPSVGIVFCTEDHSLVNALLKNEVITPEEAVSHPQRNVITRCMNVQRDRRNYYEATIDVVRDVKAGDIFLLCSDGVYDEAGNDVISELLSCDSSLKEKRDKLAERTSDSHDNNTAILIEIKSVEKTENDNSDNVTFETSLSSDELSSFINQVGNSARKWIRKLLN